MSNDPVLSRLGFARKAGKLSLGFAASKEACLAGKAKLIAVAKDVSEKSEKEIRYFCRGKIPVGRIDKTIDEMSAAIGARAGIVSVNDRGFADALKKFEPFISCKEETHNAD